MTKYTSTHCVSIKIHIKKLTKCFSTYIPIHIISKILKGEDIDIVFDEVVNRNDFEKSDPEIETYESIEELNFPQECDDRSIIIWEDTNEKEMNDHRVQAMFKRSTNNSLSKFIISQEHYELPQRTIRANGKIYHIFKPNIYRDVQNLYRDKTSMDMTLNEFKYLTSTSWDEKYLPLTIDSTQDKSERIYRLSLNSIFVLDSSTF